MAEIVRKVDDMPKSVYIVGGGREYGDMFLDRGWCQTDTLAKADLIQFTGGADVTPAWYGEKAHATTSFNTLRDQREKLVFTIGLDKAIPMAGICRGGQFLNVMNGGQMWQHIDGHAILGTHKAVDCSTGLAHEVTSTHHQMMKPNFQRKDMIVILKAGETTFKERMGRTDGDSDGVIAVLNPSPIDDVEAVYYQDTQSLCFQPHPEFIGYDELANLYFDYLNEWLGVHTT